MYARGAFARRLVQHLVIIVALAGVLLASASAALAQAPPSSDQGPRFNQWGPGQSAPAPEGPTGGDSASPQRDAPPSANRDYAPAPGFPGAVPAPYSAPGPYAAPAPPPEFLPAPPDRWDGCTYDLRGSWQLSGRQTDPYPFSYSSWIHVRQFRNWLQIEQPEDNLSYYGVCHGDRIELDVYSAGRFVGYEDGVVSWSSSPTAWGRFSTGPRARGMRVRAEWTSFFGGYASGRETWYRW